MHRRVPIPTDKVGRAHMRRFGTLHKAPWNRKLNVLNTKMPTEKGIEFPMVYYAKQPVSVARWTLSGTASQYFGDKRACEA